MSSNQKPNQNPNLNSDQTISTEARLIQPTTGLRRGMGWLPDRPDFRDYHEGTSEIRDILDSEEQLKREIRKKPSLDEAMTIPPLSRRVKADSLPASVDLRDYCSPVEDQGQLARAQLTPASASLSTTSAAPSAATWMPRASSSTKLPAT